MPPSSYLDPMKSLKEFGGKVFIFMAAMVGISIGKSCMQDRHQATKLEAPEQRYARERNAQMVERIMNGEKPKPKEEKRKYPRALPGGGLDWTGVERPK